MDAPRYRAQPASDTGGFGNSYLRWTLLHSLVVVAICTLPIWMSLVSPSETVYVNTGFMALFTLMWLWIACNAVWNFCQMLAWPNRDHSLSTLSEVAQRRKFKHIVVVPCYLDPIEVLFDCLGSLLMQNCPRQLLVVVAFEKKTPEVESKIRTVQKAFIGFFGELIISVHTIAWETEIPGGCSNKNFALHTAHRHVAEHDPEFQQTSYTVTTCDTDSLFSPSYFAALEYHYNRENPSELSASTAVQMCVWQAPLFYNWDLDKRPFFNRVTGIMRSLMMLGGLICFNLNPMSIFSYPLELGLEAGFINPRYSVDDIIFLVRMMCNGNSRIPVKLLPVPCISGPTIGTTYWEEVDEWARQIRRWSIGSSESFHYFITHFRGRPFFAGLQWFFSFFMYYAVLLCTAGVFGLMAALPFPWMEYPAPYWKYVGLAMLATQYLAIYLVFLVAFWIDYKAVRFMTVKEDIHPLRRFLHLLSAPIVLLVYNIIALYAVIKFAFRGRKDAGHIMAAKAGFGSTTADRSLAIAEPVLVQPTAQGEISRGPSEADISTAESLLSERLGPLESCSFGSEEQRASSWTAACDSESPQSMLSSRPGTFPMMSSKQEKMGSSPLQLPHLQVHAGDEVLCELPPCFFFGATELYPHSVERAQATAHIYRV